MGIFMKADFYFTKWFLHQIAEKPAEKQLGAFPRKRYLFPDDFQKRQGTQKRRPTLLSVCILPSAFRRHFSLDREKGPPSKLLFYTYFQVSEYYIKFLNRSGIRNDDGLK